MVSSASFCDFVDIETDYLTRQVQLRMVTWWYLLPLYIGGVLIVAGLTDPFRSSLFEPIFLSIYMAICTALFVFIWWLNQMARKKHLEPLLDYYVEIRKAVESGETKGVDSENVGKKQPAIPSVRHDAKCRR